MMKKFLTCTMAVAMALAITAVAGAQEPSKATRQRRTAPEATKADTPPTSTVVGAKTNAAPVEVLVGDDPQSLPGDTKATASQTPSDIPQDTAANRHEDASEEAAIVPYYNNFFSTYRLGPEDVISVTVFGQDRYSKSGITIPPSGRISLALIPGGIFVNGKTVDEVAELIKKQYDEYIIDPQVTVSLDKGFSYRYAVI